MTKKEDMDAAFKNLLETHQTRSKMSQIWEIYAEIVELRNCGVSIKDIEAVLNERGFALKTGSLSSYLCRIRRETGLSAGMSTLTQAEPKPKRAKATPPLNAEKLTAYRIRLQALASDRSC